MTTSISKVHKRIFPTGLTTTGELNRSWRDQTSFRPAIARKFDETTSSPVVALLSGARAIVPVLLA
jgi:hypothetical protein